MNKYALKKTLADNDTRFSDDISPIMHHLTNKTKVHKLI